jgi:hypothetical protein
MTAVSAIQAPVAAGPDARRASGADVQGRERPLRVVGGSTRVTAARAAQASVAATEPRSSSIRVPGTVPILTGTIVRDRWPRPSYAADPRRTAGAGHTSLRLTRRGRTVVAVLVVAVVSVLVLLVTTLASGRAQATGHGQARAGYQGMHQVVVRPGQTLWSIAAAAVPTADPRNVVQEIMTVNALNGPSISAGQLLWVP